MPRRLSLGLAALLAACAQTPPPAPQVAPEPPAVQAPAMEEPPAAAPAAAPAPAPARPSTAQEKAEAQKLALRAVELLNAGDEPTARRELGRALSLDADSKLAASLMRQVTEDTIAVHGTQSFTYRVQPNESLSMIAKRFFGDLYMFYMLARYNDIKVPKQVHAGQVIKIPGKAPSAAAAAESPPQRAPERAPATARGKEPQVALAKPQPGTTAPGASEPVSPGAKAFQQGLQLLQRGEKEGAYAAFTQTVRADPQHSEARAQAEQLRQELVQHYQRLATTAFHRQDMATTIKHYNRVLELDPNNASAKVNRERAIELSSRIEGFKGK